MVRFVKNSPGADALQVIKKINRYVETENDSIILLEDAIVEIGTEISEVRKQCEFVSKLDNYPEIMAGGKFSFFVKRVVRKMVWWVIYPSVERQTRFNNYTLQYLDLLDEKLQVVEKAVLSLDKKEEKKGNEI